MGMVTAIALFWSNKPNPATAAKRENKPERERGPLKPTTKTQQPSHTRHLANHNHAHVVGGSAVGALGGDGGVAGYEYHNRTKPRVLAATAVAVMKFV
jgi:hypothetical protein